MAGRDTDSDAKMQGCDQSVASSRHLTSALLGLILLALMTVLRREVSGSVFHVAMFLEELWYFRRTWYST